MMAFGTAPGQELKDDWDARPDWKFSLEDYTFLPSYHLLTYFVTHRRSKFGYRPKQEEVGALLSNLKRLRASYTDTGIRRAMDRFYLTRTSQTHDRPALAFCNREFQELLFKDSEMLEETDSVMEFIAWGCVRSDRMDLPWEPEADSTIRYMFIIDPDFNRLIRTYPDVVADVLTEHGMDNTMMSLAVQQMKYVAGELDQAPDLSPLSAIRLPSDFLTRQRPRRAQKTITDAVRASRGR